MSKTAYLSTSQSFNNMLKESTVLCFYFVLITCFFEEAATILFSSNSLEIEIPQGKLRGSYSWLENQNKFLGIPYASVRERYEVSKNIFINIMTY